MARISVVFVKKRYDFEEKLDISVKKAKKYLQNRKTYVIM